METRKGLVCSFRVFMCKRGTFLKFVKKQQKTFFKFVKNEVYTFGKIVI